MKSRKRLAQNTFLLQISASCIASCRQLRSCVKVEVAVLGFPSLISLMVSVHVKHQERKDGVTDTGSQT